MPRTILENVWKRYVEAGKRLGLEDMLMKELTSFKLRLSFDIAAKVGGNNERLKAVRVWHRGPLADCVFKGGNRYMEGITLGSLESHAAEMSVKCWLHQLPYGGAKGGVDVDPYKCSPEELEALTYRFVDELNERNAIGPFRDVPAPDIGTNSLIMFWMAERYKYLHRGEPFAKAVVTGKPVVLENAYVGGIHGRAEATGYGLWVVLDELRKDKYGLFTLPAEPTVAIQGFGSVGMHAAIFLHQSGYKVIAIADKFGGVFNSKGLDISKLVEYAKGQRPASVAGFKDGDSISNKELLALSCDVLVPAATEEVITAENVEEVKAKIILEGANGPTTLEADTVLESKTEVAIPDIFANSMGVLVSFFEWGMNTNLADPRVPRRNDKKLVLRSAEKMMRFVAEEIVDRSRKHKVSLRLAAYILALEKAELLRARRISDYALKVFGR